MGWYLGEDLISENYYVLSNVTITATWNTNQYTITWLNYDGTVLETDNNVLFGSIPKYDGATPTKTSSNDYDFIFSGWSPEVVSVVEKATYVAHFTQNLKYIPINTANELNNIRNNLSGNYRLMNNIDLQNNEWVPIGTENDPFTGILDGQNYTISNLKISKSQLYVGLFGYNEGSINNLKLANVNIFVTLESSLNIYGGAFIGYNNSNSNLDKLSTLNGNIKILIKSRVNNVGYAGGLIGYQSKHITISNSSNNVNLSGELLSSIAGLVGHGAIILSNSFNKGSVSGGSNLLGSDFVGGLVGVAYSSIDITDSFNSGSISGNSYVGGLVGLVGNYRNTVVITDSYNSGFVSSLLGNGYGSYLGGFLGFLGNGNSITIIKSFNSGFVSSSLGDGIGGFVGGTSASYVTLSESHNSGSISGKSYVGGLIGLGSDSSITISNSFNSGSVMGKDFIGGLVGWGDLTNISNSYNCGFVNGDNIVGGLLGKGPVTISNSFNSGSVSGNSYVGGLVGAPSSPLYSELYVYNSINFGNVLASSNATLVGGITGFLPSTTDIKQTYYSGSVTSNGAVVDGVAFGTQVTDLSIFNLEFLTTTLGWDTDIWDFTDLDIANGVYPTLKNMPEIPSEE